MADKDDLNLEEAEATPEKKKKFQMPKFPKLPSLPKKKRGDAAEISEKEGEEVKEKTEKVSAKPEKIKAEAEDKSEEGKKSGLSLPLKIMMGVVALLAVILIILIIFIVRANSNKQDAIQDEMAQNLEQAAIDSELEAAREIQEAALATETPAPPVDVVLDLIPEIPAGQPIEKMALYMPPLIPAGEAAANDIQIPAESNVDSMALTDGKRHIARFDDIIYTNFLAARDAQTKLEEAYALFKNESVEKSAFMTYCEQVLTYQHDVTARINNDGNSNASAYIAACENYLYLARNSAANLIDYLKTTGSEDLLLLAEDTISQTDAAAPLLSETRRAYLLAEGFSAEELSPLKN